MSPGQPLKSMEQVTMDSRALPKSGIHLPPFPEGRGLISVDERLALETCSIAF